MIVIELRSHERVPDGAERAAWEQLLDADPHASVFHHPRYLELWHRVLGQRFPLRVHTAHDADRLVGVIADANDRAGGPEGPLELRRFLGGTEVTDYLGPISRVADRADVADAYVRNLVADVDWDEFIASGLATDSGWPDAFRRAVDNNGLKVMHEEVDDVCPRVDISGGHAAYLKQLPARARQELSRKVRKLSREVGPLELVEIAPDDLDEELPRFLDQAARSAPEKKSFFARDEVRDWFKALGREFAADHVFRLHRLDADGMPAAMTVSLVGYGQWGLYNSSFDPDLAAFAPGMAIIWLLIEQACDEGLEVFDLLRGSESYKYRFGAEDRTLERMVIVRT